MNLIILDRILIDYKENEGLFNLKLMNQIDSGPSEALFLINNEHCMI